jgi:hypothetical protein
LRFSSYGFGCGDHAKNLRRENKRFNSRVAVIGAVEGAMKYGRTSTHRNATGSERINLENHYD